MLFRACRGTVPVRRTAILLWLARTTATAALLRLLIGRRILARTVLRSRRLLLRSRAATITGAPARHLDFARRKLLGNGRNIGLLSGMLAAALRGSALALILGRLVCALGLIAHRCRAERVVSLLAG